ncbi:lysyl oxidase family protein [Hyalangium rubrum]|uniref:Lysyl oxidase family protein n=1 Tax=Hyalangium rubrum TaxID=3103134 RepID=A0ABU5H026_9BACT|nr:lysyl oxidase family protein [Hyalangium sp. s54d21]MDY7225460.1 lysyl oxidase family protein [Hyalangium sp. s54d21]
MRKVLTWLGALAVLGIACVDDDTLYSATWVEPTAPLRAPPSRGGIVSLSLKNEGTAKWKPREVYVMPRPGQEAWAGGTLHISQDVKPGEVGTFRGALAGPGVVGLHELEWGTWVRGVAFGESLKTQVEVTCSDGTFCNGEERFTNGQCVSGPPPCDDGAECTQDACNEATRACEHTPTGTCAVCMASCERDCTGKQCGDDRCGGSCGACPAGEACAQGIFACKPETQPGTCRAPLPLLAEGTPLVGDHTIDGDSSGGLHQAVPSCNRTSTAVETVYSFTLTERLGLEARVSGYDTVLHLRKKRGEDGAADCLDNTPARTIACSDDSSPPGEYGSRISVALDPGTYYLIVDGFDASNLGPFALQVRFAAEGCVPKCDGLYCGGSDGCGGNCGVCESGQVCVRGKCLPSPCTPVCDGRECGDDQCGGQCGFCPDAKLCVPLTGKCETFAKCDHLRPTCEPGCGEGQFCGSDCQCHGVRAPLPDLMVDEARLKDEILFDTVFVTENSCAKVEECVSGTGARRVLRFSVEAVNQGFATLTVPQPAERPDLFTLSPCHGHYHFSGFASYALLDGQGRTVLNGRKQAYCMEDTQRVAMGPDVPCSKRFNCDNQGIQRGWSDLYGNTLDCQWLDITDVPPGDYRLQVTLNPTRAFQELTLDNNTTSVPVTIPAP